MVILVEMQVLKNLIIELMVSRKMVLILNLTTLLAVSEDDTLMIVVLFFQENRIWYFMQIVSIGEGRQFA